MTNHIVLFEPLIPANTGNIARTAAATDSYLHLIKPLGFEVDDKHLKRAGLDYWDAVKVVYHDSLDDFLATVPDQKYLYLISKFADDTYSDRDLSATDVDHYFLFGKETTGLPEPFMRANPEKALRIPMTDKCAHSISQIRLLWSSMKLCDNKILLAWNAIIPMNMTN